MVLHYYVILGMCLEVNHAEKELKFILIVQGDVFKLCYYDGGVHNR